MLNKQRGNKTGKIHECETYGGIFPLVTTHGCSRSPWFPARKVWCVIPVRSDTREYCLYRCNRWIRFCIDSDEPNAPSQRHFGNNLGMLMLALGWWLRNELFDRSFQRTNPDSMLSSAWMADFVLCNFEVDVKQAWCFVGRWIRGAFKAWHHHVTTNNYAVYQLADELHLISQKLTWIGKLCKKLVFSSLDNSRMFFLWR